MIVTVNDLEKPSTLLESGLRMRQHRQVRLRPFGTSVIPTNSVGTPTTRSSALAAQDATLSDVVKQVIYITDIRYQAPVAKCRREAYGNGPIPANTFLVISGLAIQGVLLEIDVTAVVSK